MVVKQLPQATFRISDNELWEDFKAKAKANGANASAVFWQFAKNYVDGNLGSVDGVAVSTLNLDGIDTNLDERIDTALEKKVDFSIRNISRVANEQYESLVAVLAQHKMDSDRETEALKLELETIKTAIAALTSEATAPAKKVEASRLTELQNEVERLNNAIAIRDNEIDHHKKEISNKTHKINDLQIEIQDYHREQLEKSGISLPPREETVLTLSGNFTQKDLDKAAKKGAKKQSTIAAPPIENPLPNTTLSDAIAATEMDISKGMDINKAFELAKQRGCKRAKADYFRDAYRGKPDYGKKYGIDRVEFKDGTAGYLYFDIQTQS